MTFSIRQPTTGKRLRNMLMTALLIVFIVAGCASYGKLSRLPYNETDALLTDLLSKTNQYVIHYHGNSEQLVSGILFDPRDNGKSIRPEGYLWNAVSDPGTIASIIDEIQRSNFPNYFPRWYEINDPDGSFYGYIFTGWSYLVIRPVDEQTLRIYGLSGPPEYEDYSSGGR